eukprot:5481279-Pyramimonas_sp.AAC.1
MAALRSRRVSWCRPTCNVDAARTCSKRLGSPGPSLSVGSDERGAIAQGGFANLLTQLASPAPPGARRPQ